MRQQTHEGASLDTLRRHNRGLVLRQIFKEGPVSRTRIAEFTGLTNAAISRITRELIDAGLVLEGDSVAPKGKPGRRFVELSLAPEGAYVLGFGAGAFEQWVRLSDARGMVVARTRLRLLDIKSPDDTIDRVASALENLVEVHGIDRRRVMGVGAAVAGVVDFARGVVVRSPNLGWRDLPLAAGLGSRLKLPVRVESLHHAFNLTEARLGDTVGLSHVVLVNAALGLGSSILAGGRLLRGRAAAGQIGHMAVPDADEVCTCGRRGCLDTVASGHAVLTRLGLLAQRRTAREHDVGDAALLTRAMERETEGDAETAEAFNAAGARLGLALTAVRSVVDPECIVLAGPLAQVESYVSGVRHALSAGDEPPADPIALVVSRQSVDAAGAWLALDGYVLGDAINLDPLQRGSG
ncbi:MAG: ROK family protein [Methyloligellaceae bacterium]